jgi:short-chain Z-isoprenyl diphosphate synthase
LPLAWLARLRRWTRATLEWATWPVYQLYEERLARQVSARPPPQHVGIILDGNRRYARREGLPHAREAYRLGAEKLDDVIEWCVGLGIPAVTLWVCSTENFERPADQVAGILAAVERKMQAVARDPQVHRHRVRVRAIGRLELLPPTALAAIRAAEDATAGYDGMQLSIAVAYGGREEIADAVRKLLQEAAAEGRTLAEAAGRVTPEAIGRCLYLADAPSPDLIIRSSGEVRLSGFLLWQSAASEFYFSDVLWPAFRRIDFLRAIRSFQERTRRFGR